MSIEDRVRAATRARADLVTRHRPLHLPAESPAGARRGQHARRWIGLGAPFAAAALVIVLAVVLVVVRQAGGSQPGSGTPASSASLLASAPRYYVAVANTSSTSSTSGQMKAVVGDDHTGRVVAVVNPSSTQSFYGVAGAADDRTFVLANYTAATKQTTFYLLCISPVSAHPAQLEMLSVSSITDRVTGLALSPDGSKLAVMWRVPAGSAKAVTHLSVYSVSTGAVLGSWLTAAEDTVTFDNYVSALVLPNGTRLPGHLVTNAATFVGGAPNSAGLSWVDGGASLDFQWAAGVTQPAKTVAGSFAIRTISVTDAGHDLLADSQQVMPLPTDTSPTSAVRASPCGSSVTADNGTLVCGSSGYSEVNSDHACAVAPPAYTTYSAATGKQLKVLYRYQSPPCLSQQSLVLWANATGSDVLALIQRTVPGEPAEPSLFGLVSGGHFTALPGLTIGTGSAGAVGLSAFDTIGGIAF